LKHWGIGEGRILRDRTSAITADAPRRLRRAKRKQAPRTWRPDDVIALRNLSVSTRLFRAPVMIYFPVILSGVAREMSNAEKTNETGHY
jgi:hypothetical protein